MKHVASIVLLSGSLMLPTLVHARQSKVATSTSKTTIRVIHRGAAPRSLLRYKLQPGKTTLRARIRMGMKMDRSKTRWVPMRLGMQVSFGKRLASGHQPYRVQLLEFLVANKPLPAAARAKLLKVAISGRVSPRGITAGVKLAAKNIPASLRQGLEQYRQCMTRSFVQFPKQALGKGGVWEATAVKQLDLGGVKIRVRTVTRYRLVHRRGGALVLRVTSRMSARPQTLKKGATTVKIHRLQGKSKGTHRIDLVRFKPRITLSSSSSVDIDSGIRLALHVLQRIKIRSK